MAKERTIANYHVLNDNVRIRVTPDRPNGMALPFDAPFDMVRADEGRFKPVLSYEVDADEGGAAFTVHMRRPGVGDFKEVDRHVIGGDSRTYFEPFEASLAGSAGSANISFELRSGDGANFSNVIVWFHRTIEV